MLAKLKSFSLFGIIGYRVDIEVDITNGIPAFETVGLPDTAIKESRERVRSAIKNSGFLFPVKRIIANLAPADTKKEGVIFDLPIAIAILAASEQLINLKYKDYIILGELSLDGSVKHIRGILPIIISGLQNGYRKFIIPFENASEASFIEGIEVYPVKNLKEAIDFINSTLIIKPLELKSYKSVLTESKYGLDFSDVKGQYVAKRALEIAVAGGHNIMMIGPPGAGKTMLAKCVPTIMPPMTYDEAIEVTKVHSIAGILDNQTGIVLNRPFRSPHHTATGMALVGGGTKSKPGEISLAHNGVLFLDEMPEYPRGVLETLRQPLEDGVITVTRVQQSIEYPAEFMLVASMNPCPCGNFGSKTLICQCSTAQIHNYLSKLSAPLMDRIDLHVEVDSVTYSDLRKEHNEENSEMIRNRVIKARNIQLERFKNEGIFTNSRMNNALIKKYCQINDESERLLQYAFEKLNLSARGISRILKVARTIADISGSTNIETAHITEAIQYRSLDRKYRM